MRSNYGRSSLYVRRYASAGRKAQASLWPFLFLFWGLCWGYLKYKGWL